MADHRGKLDKETRDRHFPETNGGKGSLPRKSTKSSRPGRHTLTTGIGYSVPKTRAQLNRETRQAEMRKKIEASGYETHVHEVVKKLLDPEQEYDSIEVQRMKSAADLVYQDDG